MSLSILHVSDNGLPDRRIQKSAESTRLKNKDNKIYFAGLANLGSINYSFDWTYTLSWDYRARYFYPHEWNALKKQLATIIVDCKPDIIHAHDIFAVKLVKDLNKTAKLGLPFIYDNHEYWTKAVIYQYLENDDYKKREADNASKPALWRNWELEIIKDNEIPMIVPSKIVEDELKYSNKDALVYLLPNYPTLDEVLEITEPVEHKESISSIFTNLGLPLPGEKTPFKNIDGFFNLFKNGELGILHTIGWNEPWQSYINHHGPLTRTELYNQLSKSDIGIIPWKPHPFHPYCSPNRAYEYAHAGLLLVIPTSLDTIFSDMDDLVAGFKEYSEIAETIKLYQENPRLLLEYRIKTQNKARQKLLWENYEDNIFEAYNKVLG